MNKFAKIFEINGYQILVTKDEDIDDDSFLVAQTIDLGDVRPKMSIGFDTEEKRDVCFNNYTDDNAEKFLNIIIAMLKP